ncbi:hypothetical protein NTE_03518 [Candidatus Nitrososphaera evergladensis SR1]|uniref:Uncharacterized protein n=1 Tax=Candidatus Nitrososphaera evergladensis SR1 TaxID=1459636 RepID=A0A075MV70_9ARCH|nr:hypothetical protein NTE_03518 [Candidatus Nitrososphaera evergladensis SR1]
MTHRYTVYVGYPAFTLKGGGYYFRIIIDVLDTR